MVAAGSKVYVPDAGGRDDNDDGDGVEDGEERLEEGRMRAGIAAGKETSTGLETAFMKDLRTVRTE